MRPQLGALRRATEACHDEDFDQFTGGCVRAMLVSRWFAGGQLEEAMTMGSVMTAFERGLEEMVSRGRVEGIEQGRAPAGLMPQLTDQGAHRP